MWCCPRTDFTCTGERAISCICDRPSCVSENPNHDRDRNRDLRVLQSSWSNFEVLTNTSPPGFPKPSDDRGDEADGHVDGADERSSVGGRVGGAGGEGILFQGEDGVQLLVGKENEAFG